MKWDENGHATAADVIHENAFWHADLLEAASLLVEVIREVRPQVLVTYDEFGNYGHPDHIQAHRVAHYAADLAAARSFRPELGEAWDVAKIYWVAMSASRFRAEPPEHARRGGHDDVRGHGPRQPAAVRDRGRVPRRDDRRAGAHRRAKLAAMKAHATQITADGAFFAGGIDAIGRQAWGSEFYRLVKGPRGPVGDSGYEEDLFAGL